MREGAPTPAVDRSAVPPAGLSRWRRIVLVSSAGAFGLGAQTVLLREQFVAFGGNELGTGAFLSVWLAWVGIGALLGRAWLRRRPEAARLAPWLALLWLPAVALELAFLHELRALCVVGPAEVFPLERLLLALIPGNAPVCLLTGVVFTLLSGRDAGETTGLYAWEAAGCLLGGAGITAALLLGLDPLSATAAIGLLPVMGALGASRRASVAALLAGLACAATLAGGGEAVQGRLAAADLARLLPGAELLATRDTRYARWTVARTGGQVVVLVDGQVVAAHPDPAGAPLEAALAMAEADGPRRILVVGGATEQLCAELLRWEDVERIDRVVLDVEADRMIAPLLPEETLAALRDQRLQTASGDPRALVGHELAGPWDLAVVAAPDPGTASAARLYSLDFYRQVGALMSPRGVIATRAVSGENFLGPELAAHGGSVLATLREATSEVVVLPGDPSRFFASAAPGVVTSDPEELARRHRLSRTGSRFPDSGFASLIDARRTAFVREAYGRKDPAGRSLVATDERPVSYTLALGVQGRISGSGWVRAMHGARAAGAWLVAVPLVLVLLLGVHRMLARPEPEAEGDALAGAAVFAAGFASIALGIVLLFCLQSRAGVLFGRVGLASAALLAGIALGAAAGRSLSIRLDPLAERSASRLPRSPVVALVLLGALAACVPFAVDALPQGPSAEPGLLLLLALCGLACGLVFPAGAVARVSEHPGGPLFAADHLGGALGAAVIGVAVLPLLGVAGACAAVAGLQGVTAALILARHARGWLLAEGPRPAGTLLRRLLGWQRRTGSRPESLLWPGWGYVLSGLAAAAVLLGAVAGLRLDRPKVRFSPIELATLGGGGSYVERADPFVHYVGSGPGGDADHVLLASMAVRDDVQGYAGPIGLLVVVGRDGTYLRVDVLESRETPAYMAGVARWVRGLAGRSVAERLALADDGGEVDGVTGATVSARAALATLDATGAEVAARVLRLPVAAPEVRSWHPRPTREALALLVLLPPCVASTLLGWRRARTLLLLTSLAVLGFWLNAGLSLESLAGTLRGHPPKLASFAAWLLVFGIGTTTLLVGPAWCSALCPLGALQELLGRLRLTRALDPALDRRARQAKYVLLALALAGFGLTARRGWLSFDPLAHAFVRWPTGVAAALLALVLAGSLLVFRPWCRYLCPTGALLSLGNRVLMLGRWLPRRAFARCDLGVLSPDDLDCLQCGRCGAPEPPREGPVAVAGRRPGRGRADGLLLLWLVLALVLVAASVAGGGPAADVATGGARDADIEEIRRLIDEGKLSDREAEWWSVGQ